MIYKGNRYSISVCYSDSKTPPDPGEFVKLPCNVYLFDNRVKQALKKDREKWIDCALSYYSKLKKTKSKQARTVRVWRQL